MQVSIIHRLCLFGLALFMPLLASATPTPQSYGELDLDAFQKTPRTTWNIEDFSDRYRATLELNDEQEVFRPGILRVYDKNSGAELIQVSSDELVLAIDDKSGDVKSNVHELPYGEQSVLIYDDFNFDGIKDLALMDGQFSCYHGPSFQVFLGTPDGFRHSDSFTELAQNYCGFFDYDAESRTINVSAKDGCCRHWFSTYEVVNGEPVLKAEREVDYTGVPGISTHTVTWVVDGTKVVSTTQMWEEDDQRQVLLSFRLAPSGKRIMLFRPDKTSPVNYAAVNDKDEVDLLYPDSDPEALEYSSDRHVLSFVRGDTTYRILGDAKGKPLGMEVVIKGKTTPLKLQPGSVQGSLLKVWEAMQETGP